METVKSSGSNKLTRRRFLARAGILAGTVLAGCEPRFVSPPLLGIKELSDGLEGLVGKLVTTEGNIELVDADIIIVPNLFVNNRVPPQYDNIILVLNLLDKKDQQVKIIATRSLPEKPHNLVNRDNLSKMYGPNPYKITGQVKFGKVKGQEAMEQERNGRRGVYYMDIWTADEIPFSSSSSR